MRAQRSGPTADLSLNDGMLAEGGASMSALVRRQVAFAGGAALMAFVLFAIVAISTWNVADPSLSHATDATVTNLMGAPGAILADLAMQFLGLASLVALVPLAFSAQALIRDRMSGHGLRRTAAGIGGVILAAGAAGTIPATSAWPLPTGPGGAIGDLVLSVPGLFLGGYPQGLAAVVVFLATAGAAMALVRLACGFGWQPAQDTDEDGDTGSIVTLGAALHGLYVLRASVRRLLPQALRPSRARKTTAIRREPAVAATGGARREPVMAPAFDPAEGAGHETLADDAMPWDEDAPVEDDDWGIEPPRPAPAPAAPSLAPVPAPRVAAPPAPAKPSVRVQREAQPSLIREDGFELPPIRLLRQAPPAARDDTLSAEALEQNARLLEGVLEDFGVRGEIIHVRPGPVVTLYELEPAPGIKSSRVIGLAEDIARSMSAIAARVAVVPGRNAIGIELPNAKRETVYLSEMISSQAYDKSKARLSLALGKTINGDAVIADLAKMPHLLVAGTTGSGKSVAINTMILSLVYKMTPEQCRLIMIDPKMLELSVYDGIPHLLTPVVTDPKKAVVALKWTVREMEQRYKNMSKVGVRNIDGFNQRVAEAKARGEQISRTVQTGFDRQTGEAIYETETLDLEAMPYIVVIIDEMADLMMVAGKDIEGAVQRLAQMARAAGIHVIMATQRPSVDVITGTIKANFPTRISFQVTSKIDSRTILGEQGAEQLLGMGDMLYMAGGGRIQRVHGPFVSDQEVEEIVSHLKLQGVPQYLDAVTQDDDEDEDGPAGGGAGEAGAWADESEDPYDQAVAVVLRDRKASTSYIQRRLGIGYNRAASIIERMEDEGIVGPANHAGKREILVPSEEERMAGM